MPEISITLLSNRQNKQSNAEDLKIVAGENKATTIAVEFPGELAAHSKRIDFMNSRGERWTEPLYMPEDERNEYPATFDKSNFTFTLPDAITLPGELLLQFLAYVPGTEQTMTFELIRLTVEDFIGNYNKRAPRNPDLVIKAYEYSNKALDIARDSLARTVDSERAAKESEAAAIEAKKAAQASAVSSGKSEASSNDSAVSSAKSLAYAQSSAESSEASRVSSESANIRAASAEAASKASAASSASADTRATKAEAESVASAKSAEQANARAAVAEASVKLSEGYAAASKSSSESADTRAGNAEEFAKQAAASAKLAVDQTGTKVEVGSAIQLSMHFDTDPQTQITQVKAIANGKSIVKVNGTKADISFTSDPQTQINSIKAAAESKSVVNVNGVKTDVTFTSDPQAQINNKLNTADLVSHLLSKVYPVGSIYMSLVNTSPASFLAGSWAVWGTGRVPVGVNTADGNFYTPNLSGGASTVTLTTTQIPSHRHRYGAAGIPYSGTFNDGQTIIGRTDNKCESGGGGVWYFNDVNSYATGGSGAHNNLQPYTTCYMWRRVS